MRFGVLVGLVGGVPGGGAHTSNITRFSEKPKGFFSRSRIIFRVLGEIRRNYGEIPGKRAGIGGRGHAMQGGTGAGRAGWQMGATGGRRARKSEILPENLPPPPPILYHNGNYIGGIPRA